MSVRLSSLSVAATVLCVTIVLCDTNAQGDEPLAAYYDGLRARGLFSVAEGDALRRLGKTGLPTAERAELAIELSRSYAAHAANAVGVEREELWSQAAEVVGQLAKTNPRQPYRALLMTQAAMVPAARGAQLRWQEELFPLDAATRQQAQSVLQDALDRLQPLPEALDAARLQSQLDLSKGAAPASFAAPARIHQQSRLVDYTLAAATLDLAKVRSPGADRTASLHEADQRFAELVKIARPDAIAWQSRVHRLDILRLRQQYDRLPSSVAAFIKTDPPATFRDAAVAIAVRGWLDQDRPDEALATLEEHREEHGLAAEELQALVVESLLAARRIAREKNDAALAEELLTRARSVDARLSGAWRSRTRTLLERAREEDRYGPALAPHVREGQWAWQNGNVDKAIAAYGRAASQAHKEGQADYAVEFALAAASAQVEAGRFEAAVSSLEELLRGYPSHAKSAEANLLRAYAIGRLFEQQPTNERKETYRAALEQHGRSFPDSPTTAEAMWMQARLAEYEQDWPTAIDLLSAIPSGSEKHPSAVVRLAVVFEKLLEEQRSEREAIKEIEQRAIETLTVAIATFPTEGRGLTREQASVLWRLAKIHLRRTPPDFDRADRLLARVIDNAAHRERDTGTLDAQWQSLSASASQLRIISLTGQGRLADARQMLERVAAQRPSALLDMLNGLTQIADEIGIQHRADVGQMQLELANRVQTQSASLSEADARKLDMARAQASAAIGQWQTAARVYEELLWKQPQDTVVLMALAQLYEDCGTASCLRQAVKQWQTLEKRQRQGTVDWLQSRYHMAWCSHRLGEDDAAKKLIAVTRVLYPQLGTPALKARYEALAAEVLK